jgi:hypothetical protein
MVAGPQTFAEAIDVIEATYEFLLAYAAQGCRREDEDAGSGIRERLIQAEAALGTIASATMEAIPAEAAQAAATGEFLAVVKEGRCRPRQDRIPLRARAARDWLASRRQPQCHNARAHAVNRPVSA